MIHVLGFRLDTMVVGLITNRNFEPKQLDIYVSVTSDDPKIGHTWVSYIWILKHTYLGLVSLSITLRGLSIDVQRLDSHIAK